MVKSGVVFCVTLDLPSHTEMVKSGPVFCVTLDVPSHIEMVNNGVVFCVTVDVPSCIEMVKNGGVFCVTVDVPSRIEMVKNGVVFFVTVDVSSHTEMVKNGVVFCVTVDVPSHIEMVKSGVVFCVTVDVPSHGARVTGYQQQPHQSGQRPRHHQGPAGGGAVGRAWWVLRQCKLRWPCFHGNGGRYSPFAPHPLGSGLWAVDFFCACLLLDMTSYLKVIPLELHHAITCMHFPVLSVGQLGFMLLVTLPWKETGDVWCHFLSGISGCHFIPVSYLLSFFY